MQVRRRLRICVRTTHMRKGEIIWLSYFLPLLQDATSFANHSIAEASPPLKRVLLRKCGSLSCSISLSYDLIRQSFPLLPLYDTPTALIRCHGCDVSSY